MVKVEAITMTSFYPLARLLGRTQMAAESRRKGLRLVMFHVKQIRKI